MRAGEGSERTMPGGMVLSLMNPKSLTTRSLKHMKHRSPGDLNRPEWRAVEVPAGRGVGQVKSIAKAHGVFATGGEELRITPEAMSALTRPAEPPSPGTRYMVLHTDTLFSSGYMKPFPSFRFSTPGCRVSFGYADPDLGWASPTLRTGSASRCGTNRARRLCATPSTRVSNRG